MRRATSFLFAVVLIISCKTANVPNGDDGKIEVTFVQVNDVYEIAPLEGGKTGGMARVATLKKQELQKNPNTFLVMSGDFVSPSVYGSLTYQGKKIRGKQMIDAMNAAGFNIVTFGNHEFDIAEKELQERIDESKFTWISANAFHLINKTPVSFQNSITHEFVHNYYFKTITDADGTTARIGFFGVVLPSNPAEYVKYTDPVTTAIETYNLIKDSCDAVVAITHVSIADDKRIADALPGLAAILGGHEHGGVFEKENGVYISKARANAKTAYVVKLKINKQRHKVKTVKPELVYLNENVALDSSANVVVQKWSKIAEDVYATSGFNAKAIVPYNGEPLEGREKPVRSSSTNLTRLITDAMLFAAPQADAAIFNSGSIRVDDVLYPPITQYDILRMLPFGGGVRELDLKGSLLIQTLDVGKKNSGIGGYLQYGNISYNETSNSWSLKGQPIDSNKTYRVVTSDFLITGKEANLDFFNEKNPAVVKMYPAKITVGDVQSDIRLAVIKYLEQKK
jgi:2',3'-cyclic-nucleotide 2'-phosphodiesterase (5'-nucleotidase family)